MAVFMYFILVIRIVTGDPFEKKESVWFVPGHRVKVLLLSEWYG